MLSCVNLNLQIWFFLYFLVAIPDNVCETALRSLFWAPNGFSDLPEVRFQFPFGYH